MLRFFKAAVLYHKFVPSRSRFRTRVNICSRGVQTRDDAAIMLGVARQALWAHHNPALEGRKPSIG